MWYNGLDSSKVNAHQERIAGVCGLSNLGNTCFMNSGIQCMSNTPPLTEYFLSGGYSNEINETNTLGTKGEMAKAYAELIRDMWCGKTNRVQPVNFKDSVGRFAPQFSGYHQEDSQELLSFLLSGLHEDLNRAQKKEYIEIKDNDGKSDTEAAKEAWDVYKMRNDSIIVDLFHGLLKSTVICPDCHKVSVTFDPFCYLSLPLPIKQERRMRITYVPSKMSQRLSRYSVVCPKNGTIKDLTDALLKSVHITTDFIFADVFLNRFHKFFSSTDALMDIAEKDDLYFYDLQNNPTDEKTLFVCVYNRLTPKKSVMFSMAGTLFFGFPTIALIDKENIDFESVFNALKFAICRFVNWPADDSWCQIDDDEDADVESIESKSSSRGSMKNDPYARIRRKDHSDPEVFKIYLTDSTGQMNMGHITQQNVAKCTESRDIYVYLEWHPSMLNLLNFEPKVEIVEGDSVEPLHDQKTVNLSACLDLFTMKEKLSVQDVWFCTKCKKNQQATKKFDLWSLPQILIIHLKRFSYSINARNKIEGLVVFPIKNLDLSRWVIGDKSSGTSYNLIAVSNHSGGLGGGHYTAFALNVTTSEWYVFDDGSCNKLENQEIVTEAAYVLVFARSNLKYFKEGFGRDSIFKKFAENCNKPPTCYFGESLEL